ncbi:PREDICTED: uncharacterized protein LOC105557935 [Vollenhovia emeryi]|uniref:uncharacterized protein LOC105557935 n=1 Tax=Vollenhovia emeryi TaxID=411798 RepID=UPI0005F4185A|nr:PREDICTED: uncharacterized protein LOC105557935 [Vollenhovia emeryi]
MVEAAGCGELQQLVQEEECEEPLSHGGEVTPPSTPARSQRPSKAEVHNTNVSQQILWENNAQTSPIISKGSSGQGTSQGSMVSSRAANASSYAGNQSRLTYLNEKEKEKEKEKQRPSRPDPPRIVRQHKAMVPCKHHCFLSEVPDVRHMEQALLQLLEDFHSGNLRAFGKDCSMEQMTEIREQQERLARLHFELGQRQEVGGEQSGLRQSSANMRHLLHRLQQLSIRRFVFARMKSAALSQPQRSITAHDTLERLSLAKCPAFNTLWEPKGMIGINVKATEKRHILGDEYLESTIEERPRKYMVPSVSLDDVRDKDKRKLLIDFIYKTTTGQTAREVWGDFKQCLCLSKRHVEEQDKPLTNQEIITRLPARFQGAARKWDSMQNRSFLTDDTCYYKKDKTRKERATESDAAKEIPEEVHAIRKLINENKLSIIYDKLPSSYTGYRPYFAYGVPIEKTVTYQLTN